MLVVLYRSVKVEFSFKNEIDSLIFVYIIKGIREQDNIETLTIGGLNLQ